MEERKEAEGFDDVPPLVMSEEDWNRAIKALFDERFGGFNPTDRSHVRIRRKLFANIEISDMDESTIVIHGETARMMRGWLEDRRH